MLQHASPRVNRPTASVSRETPFRRRKDL